MTALTRPDGVILLISVGAAMAVWLTVIAWSLWRARKEPPRKFVPSKKLKSPNIP